MEQAKEYLEKIMMSLEPKGQVKEISKAESPATTKGAPLFSFAHSSRPVFPGRGLSAKKMHYSPSAIEIGSASLKLLQIAKTQNSYEIVKSAYVPLASNPQSPHHPALRDSLEKLLRDNPVSGEVVSSLPINKIHTLTYVLPHMPPGEIEQALAWKLKQNPPTGFTFEGLSFDYIANVHSRDSLSKETQVLVFVASKEAVMQHLRLFRDFSLELISVEPKPYATLSALLWLDKIRQEETVLVLQLGESQSSITVVFSAQPYLIRPLAVSGNTLTEAIARYHQFDWEKAEALKKKEGLKDWVSQPKEGQAKEESMCRQALSSQLENLVVDVEHTFKYFSHQLMKSQVTSFDRVVLCGGSSALGSLDAFLADRLAVPVEVFNPFSSSRLCLKQECAPLVKENSASFASVLGLASRYV